MLNVCAIVLRVHHMLILLTVYDLKLVFGIGKKFLRSLKGYCAVFKHALKSLEIIGIVLS